MSKKMNQPTLETLLLNPSQLEMARTQVKEMAYCKWKAAGEPNIDPLAFWRQAELEWIEFFYVPSRDDLNP